MIRDTLVVLVLFSLCSFQAANAQRPGEISYHDESVMSTGVIGERINSVINTLNAGDPQAVRRFLEDECSERFRNMAPMEEHIGVFLGLLRQTGGIDFHSVRTYVPERVGETVVILKDRNFGAWRAFTLRLDQAGLVDVLGFNDARTPTNVEEPPLTEAQVVEMIAETVGRVCANDAFSGSVLLAKGDDVLYSHACGEASKRFHVPNNIDTRFNLGSMNKMFTSTAIAQLVERGVLSYEETIDKYVDESWLPGEVTGKITIHHLLSHTSGLGSYFNETYATGSRELYRSVDDFKPLVQGDEPAFEPGDQFRYSNTGMLLLGVVIESASGGSYFDYIREHIYERAGMEHSDSYEMDYPVENLAIGYDPEPGSEYGWKNNLYKHVIKGGPAGGGFSTVGDLHRFARALVTGKLVSEGSLELMWTDHSGVGYGYGFGTGEGSQGRVVGHGGGFLGINGDLAIFVDAGYIVAVLSNYSNGASPLSSRMQDLIGRIEQRTR
jgi:CubicO group peptidase (beta-lactamase class C family)